MTQSFSPRTWGCVLLVWSALFVGTAGTASAQFETAVVLGAVHDSTGAAVPGATITLTNAETGIVASTQTDANGGYQFLNVRIGRYHVAAELSGFSGAIAKDVAVAVNARRRISVDPGRVGWAPTGARR